MLPGGVALLDYDNDGDLDVFFVQGQMPRRGKDAERCDHPTASMPLKARLFRNDLLVNPDGTRSLHSRTSPNRAASTRTGYAMGVAVGDFDNDGCVDLYVTNFGRNQLFRNNCDGNVHRCVEAERY